MRLQIPHLDRDWRRERACEGALGWYELVFALGDLDLCCVPEVRLLAPAAGATGAMVPAASTLLPRPSPSHSRTWTKVDVNSAFR